MTKSYPWREGFTPEQLLESVLPSKSERKIALEQLMASIKAANAIAPNAWSVTRLPDGFRMNVGQVEVYVMTTGYVHLNCVGTVGARPFIGEHFVTTNYLSVPQPQCRFWGTPTELARLPNSVLAAHAEFIDLAARGPKGNPRKGTAFARFHCEALVEYAATMARDTRR